MNTAKALAVVSLATGSLFSMALAGGYKSPKAIKTEFTFKTTIPKVPAGAKEVELWIPIPSDNTYQSVTDLKVSTSADWRVTTEPKFGNRMVYVRSDKAQPISVEVSMTVDRSAVQILNGDSKRVTATEAERKMFLQPDEKVPIGGRYASIAEEVSGTGSDGIDKVRSLYNHTVDTMKYDYDKESPHLGDGDVAFVCDFKKGNCSDLHSYIISLTRSEGIPAYLEYGFPVTGAPLPESVPGTGKIGGYHCWTWFYDDEIGWIPLDASDGRKWQDKDRADVRKYLFGNLVLERSAVAVSRGRDINLVPKQNGPARNHFIYPYAEADGNEVDTKWECNYRLLRITGAGDMDGTVMEQLEALRKKVMDQDKEIAALKGGNSNGGASANAVTTKEETAKLYGFVRLDTIYDTDTMDHPQFPGYVRSPDDPMVSGANDEQFNMHPRLTRLGVDLKSPHKAFGNWDVSGKIEIDFQNGGRESRPAVRARHLYAKFSNGPSSVLFGQTWDLISPLFPSPNDDSLMWNAGNLGDRRPQARYTYDNGQTNFAVALGLTGAIDAKDLDANGTRDGEDAGVPNLQARLGAKGKDFAVGIWGLVGSEKVDTAVGGETDFDVNAIGIDFKWMFAEKWDLAGEAWSGQDLSDFRGGVGQGVNTTTGKEIDSEGGWVELGYKPCDTHRIAIGYTVDDPDDDDLTGALARTYNTALYIHNKWAVSKDVDFGFNYIRWRTDFLGSRQGENDRFNLFVAYKY